MPNNDLTILFTKLVPNHASNFGPTKYETIGVFKNNTYLNEFFIGQNYVDNSQQKIDPRIFNTLQNFIAIDISTHKKKHIKTKELEGLYMGIDYIKHKLHNDDTVFYHALKKGDSNHVKN